jgi:ankyrin repeat protein
MIGETLEDEIDYRGGIDEPDDDGESLLLVILQSLGDKDYHFDENDALTLIRAGCNLDWPSVVDGAAPIHAACFMGQLGVLVEMIERNVKLDVRDDNGMTAFMYACKYEQYDCAFAVMDAGGTLNMMKMVLEEKWPERNFKRTNIFFTPPQTQRQGAQRRLQEIDQVRKSFKKWSPTLLEEQLLPFLYCENNLIELVSEPEKTIEKAKKQGQKRKRLE